MVITSKTEEKNDAIIIMISAGHVSVCVGDSSQYNEEIVKNLQLHLSMPLLLLLS